MIEPPRLVVPTHIWCENCDSVQPMVLDELTPTEISGFIVTDLICKTCKFIVATVFA